MSRKKRQPARPSTPAPVKTAPRARLGTGKKLAFAALTVLLFFGLLEGVLALCGVRPLLYQEDPYVGFAGNIPLFVPATAEDGAAIYQTAENKLRFFNAQQFPRVKSDDTTRIFCLGGSTTYGRPFDDTTSFNGQLRELLIEAAPDQDFEVINAGGISYASYRVAKLMEELARYDADLFIVYCGHNEFLEERTYGDVAEMSTSARGLGTLLARTRTFTVLRDVVGRSTNEPADHRTTPLPAEVTARLDRTVGPAAYTRDDSLRRQIVAHYRFNLNRMVDIARAAIAEIIFVVPASNLRDCTPFKSQHTAGLTNTEVEQLESQYAAAQTLLDAGDFATAEASLRALCQRDPRNAAARFLQARALDALGQYERAQAAYALAREEDVCPLRATLEMQAIVREVARQRDVPWIDFDALITARARDDIPGEDWFLDHVHPTVAGHQLLAVELLSLLDAEGDVALPSDWGSAAIDRVAARIESRRDDQQIGIGYRNLAKVLSWAGKFDEADRPSHQAVEKLPDDADAQYHRGLVLEHTGRSEEAMEHYQTAIRLQPAQALAHNNLGALYAQKNDFDEAIVHYQRAVEHDPQLTIAWKNLGVMLARRGELPTAISHFQTALKLGGDDAEIYYNLGRIYTVQGASGKATASFEQALELQPDFEDARQRLEELRKTDK